MPPCLGTWRKEKREKGKRKVASDYELNFRYFNADAFEVFEKMYELAFG